ncbi:hypothetical protein Hanom_Chr07g00642941 [Helianthus anomalus]
MYASSEQEDIAPDVEEVSGGLPPLMWIEATFYHIVTGLIYPARAQAESLVEPLIVMVAATWHRACHRCSVEFGRAGLTVVTLIVSPRKDGNAEGYRQCTRHVTEALKVERDTQ